MDEYNFKFIYNGEPIDLPKDFRSITSIDLPIVSNIIPINDELQKIIDNNSLLPLVISTTLFSKVEYGKFNIVIEIDPIAFFTLIILEDYIFTGTPYIIYNN